MAVFTLELEMDYPSETRDFIVSWSEISLCTVAPSPQTTHLRFFLRGRGGGTVHRLSGTDTPVLKLSVEIDGQSQADCSFKIKTIPVSN